MVPDNVKIKFVIFFALHKRHKVNYNKHNYYQEKAKFSQENEVERLIMESRMWQPFLQPLRRSSPIGVGRTIWQL